jgi:preprotein translocase subunit SecG
MIALISVIHVLACVALMVSILLQSGKGGGLAGAFGAGSSQTLFGGRGAATFLSRSATVLAVLFFLTSLTLGLSASHRAAGPGGRSLIQEDARRRAQQSAPAPDAAPPASPSTTPGAMPGATPTPSAPGPATSPAPETSPSPAAPQGGGTNPQAGTK